MVRFLLDLPRHDVGTGCRPPSRRPDFHPVRHRGPVVHLWVADGVSETRNLGCTRADRTRAVQFHDPLGHPYRRVPLAVARYPRESWGVESQRVPVDHPRLARVLHCLWFLLPRLPGWGPPVLGIRGHFQPPRPLASLDALTQGLRSVMPMAFPDRAGTRGGLGTSRR